MLCTFLCPKNMDQDMPDLLSYISDLKNRIEIVNKKNKSYILGHNKQILKFIIKEASEHYYASKLKVYIHDDDDEEPLDESQKLTEEETRERMEEVMKHPLFMTELPENIEDNKQLEAIQAIKYDDNSEEIGKSNLKESVKYFNQYVANKNKPNLENNKDFNINNKNNMNNFNNLKNAMVIITNAIEHCIEDETVDLIIKTELLLQRSNINIYIKNYKYAIEDLTKCLDIYNIKNKTFKFDLIDSVIDKLIDCYLELKLIDSAYKIVSKLKSIKQSQLLNKVISNDKYDAFINIEIKQIIKKIENKRKELHNELSKQEAFNNYEINEKERLYEVLSLKGIKISYQFHKIPVNCEAKIYYTDETDENIDETKENIDSLVDYINKLDFYFPILIIYEEFNMIDYIQDVSGKCTFQKIKDMILSQDLPWDKEKKYTKLSVKIFYEMNKKDNNLDSFTTYYYPILETETLIELLTNSKIEMNGFPVISVVSTNSKYYEYFIKNKIILKRKI